MTTPLTFEVEIEQPVIEVEISESIVDAILVAGPTGPRGPSPQVQAEVLEGDSTTLSFTLSHVTVSDHSVQVFRNGLAEIIGIGFFVETSASTTVVTFTTAPLDTDEVSVTYHI